MSTSEVIELEQIQVKVEIQLVRLVYYLILKIEDLTLRIYQSNLMLKLFKLVIIELEHSKP